jgi:hypothetical protein
VGGSQAANQADAHLPFRASHGRRTLIKAKPRKRGAFGSLDSGANRPCHPMRGRWAQPAAFHPPLAAAGVLIASQNPNQTLGRRGGGAPPVGRRAGASSGKETKE